jgi:nitrite reductase/ring-hydroxylating ferredoxin subunit
MAIGSMKLVRVGDRRVVLIRTSTGFHALDNACPHEGYGLVQGALDDELLTCEWHNWKFNVADGACVLGEENVASHEVSVQDDEVIVIVTEPSDEDIRASARESLLRGIDSSYSGQIARDSLRLLHAGAEPVDIVWEGVARTIGRTEYGWNHALAMSSDCLAALEGLTGDDRLTPVAQAVAALAESELRLPVRTRPTPLADAALDAAPRFRQLIESELDHDADALLTGALLNGLDRAAAARWLIQPVCDHHLAFGHGAIYVQKSFEMLDAVGWERAPMVLAHVATMLVDSTREDRLPYMRPFLRALDNLDLEGLWQHERDASWTTADRDDLVQVFIGVDQVAAVQAAHDALVRGAGIDGLLDAVALAASERMLRHDLAHEQRPDVSGYGWLDITHSLTYANAARWAWHTDPGPHTARLAFYTVFHVVDGGRHIDGAPCDRTIADPSIPLSEALATGDVEGAVAAAFSEPNADVGDALVRASLDDRSGALIVVAHHVKVARAAIREAEATGSRLPLAAAARFIAAPARQRFVANGVARARHFLTTGSPPPR